MNTYEKYLKESLNEEFDIVKKLREIGGQVSKTDYIQKKNVNYIMGRIRDIINIINKDSV